MVLRTLVQAETQNPSMTTISPELPTPLHLTDVGFDPASTIRPILGSFHGRNPLDNRTVSERADRTCTAR
jgi:hypothetical protein